VLASGTQPHVSVTKMFSCLWLKNLLLQTELDARHTESSMEAAHCLQTYIVYQLPELCEFTMVSQPIRLNLVEWFFFHFSIF
jgi:hypothetical protein